MLVKGKNLTSFNPSLDHPFIFYHLPKTGGSSIRQLMYDGIFEGLKRHERKQSFIPCFDGIPCTFKSWQLGEKNYANIFSCSVGVLSHLHPKEVGAMWFKIDLGIFGKVDCRREWWDHVEVKSLIDVDFPVNGTVKMFYDRIVSGDALLHSLLKNHVRGLNTDKLAIDVTLKSQCLLIFREPIQRSWSHFYFFKYHHETNSSFVEFCQENGVDYLIPNTDSAIQSIAIGGADSKLSNTLFDHCFIGIHERYELVADHLLDLIGEVHFVEDHQAASNKAHSIEDVPEDLRKELKVALAEETKVWKKAFKKVTGSEPGPEEAPGCSWCLDE